MSRGQIQTCSPRLGCFESMTDDLAVTGRAVTIIKALWRPHTAVWMSGLRWSQTGCVNYVCHALGLILFSWGPGLQSFSIQEVFLVIEEFMQLWAYNFIKITQLCKKLINHRLLKWSTLKFVIFCKVGFSQSLFCVVAMPWPYFRISCCFWDNFCK